MLTKTEFVIWFMRRKLTIIIWFVEILIKIIEDIAIDARARLVSGIRIHDMLQIDTTNHSLRIWLL